MGENGAVSAHGGQTSLRPRRACRSLATREGLVWGALRSPRPAESTSRIQNAGETSLQTTPGRFALGAPRARSAEPRPDPLHACWKGEKSQTLTTPGVCEDESSRSCPCPSAVGGADVGCRCGRYAVSQSRPRSSRATQHSCSCAVASGDRELTFTREPAPEVHSSPQPESHHVVRPWVLRQPRCRPTAACRRAVRRSTLSIRATSRMSLHAPQQVTKARPERQRFTKFQ